MRESLHEQNFESYYKILFENSWDYSAQGFRKHNQVLYNKECLKIRLNNNLEDWKPLLSKIWNPFEGCVNPIKRCRIPTRIEKSLFHFDITLVESMEIENYFTFESCLRPGVSLLSFKIWRRRFPPKVEPHGFFLKICFSDEWKNSGIRDAQIRVILFFVAKAFQIMKIRKVLNDFALVSTLALLV